MTVRKDESNFLVIPEVTNKVIQRLRVFHDPRDNSREVEIEFADGTELSIEVQVGTSVVARLSSTDKGAYETLNEYSDAMVHGD
ncbi:MAG TPA: hypothetical protein VGD59_05790 [Acidisarcina sp.]